jgi:hypothetical protein
MVSNFAVKRVNLYRYSSGRVDTVGGTFTASASVVAAASLQSSNLTWQGATLDFASTVAGLAMGTELETRAERRSVSPFTWTTAATQSIVADTFVLGVRLTPSAATAAAGGGASASNRLPTSSNASVTVPLKAAITKAGYGPSCVTWDAGKDAWSGASCGPASYSGNVTAKTQVTCACAVVVPANTSSSSNGGSGRRLLQTLAAFADPAAEATTTMTVREEFGCSFTGGSGPVCSGNGACDANTGRCTCAAGWASSDCSVPCAPGAGLAPCSGKGTCQAEDGSCKCFTGFAGTDCSISPSVEIVAPSTGHTIVPTAVQLRGTGFGSFDSTPQVKIGDKACTSELWISNWLVTCIIPPAVGANLQVSLTAWGLTAVSPVPFTFNRPAITRIEPNNGTTSGGGVVTIHGTAFGSTAGAEAAETVFFGAAAVKHYLQAFVGDQPCTKTTWVWDSEVRCQLPAGVGASHPITVRVANQVTAMKPGTTDFAYRAPSISFVSPMEGMYQGGGLFLMEGLNFSPNDTAVTVGGAACPIVEENFIRVKCTLPPGDGVAEVVLTVAGQRAPEVRAYVYRGRLVDLKVVSMPTRPIDNVGLLSAQPLVELRDALGDLVLSGPDAVGALGVAHVVQISVAPKPLSIGGSNLLGVTVEGGVATFTVGLYKLNPADP